ncbi:MAG TPA: undecaprenyl-diphosphate phosphatase [Gammaproteobacteria bacterium]
MELLHIVVLAVVQGLTEFLPISSSAHLILVPVVAGWSDQGLSFDMALHVGTVTAVLIYFRKQLAPMSVDWCRSVYKRQHTENSRLAWLILLGTIPAGIIGLLAKPFVEAHLRSPLVIAVTTITFGIALWLAWRFSPKRLNEYQLTVSDVLLIGIAQAVALIPGTSRSGITISMGLARGMQPQAAARFSFLLSIPVMLASGLMLVTEMLQAEGSLIWRDMIAGAVVAAISAYLCIHYFLKLINRIGMLPFVIYRLCLGAVLLLVFV